MRTILPMGPLQPRRVIKVSNFNHRLVERLHEQAALSGHRYHRYHHYMSDGSGKDHLYLWPESLQCGSHQPIEKKCTNIPVRHSRWSRSRLAARAP